MILQQAVRQAAETIALGFEIAGVALLTVGALLALAIYVRDSMRRVEPRVAYRSLRRNLGGAILLGLEFLVAADIIRTVAVEPTIQNVMVLGLIVLIRTFLSLSLDVEVEGRWPWQRARSFEATLDQGTP
jgi:uncharacterized membrane protein